MCVLLFSRADDHIVKDGDLSAPMFRLYFGLLVLHGLNDSSELHTTHRT
jgi:hypothetical protein